MITVKGQADADLAIISHIIDPSAPNVEFKNITFDCKTIKDADGNVFVRQETGEWVNEDGTPSKALYSLYCSECGEWSEYRGKFCLWCGAKMEGDNDVCIRNR